MCHLLFMICFQYRKNKGNKTVFDIESKLFSVMKTPFAFMNSINKCKQIMKDLCQPNVYLDNCNFAFPKHTQNTVQRKLQMF